MVQVADKKMLVLTFLIAALAILTSCVQPEDRPLTQEELFIREIAPEQARTGQAIAIPCRTTAVVSCLESKGFVRVILPTTRVGIVPLPALLHTSCRSNDVAYEFSCPSETQIRTCVSACSDDEVCPTQQCRLIS